MDAFFASVEQQVNPNLRNKPIAVTGSGKRTVITCPSYEARGCGVKTGMTIVEAKRLCPPILFVPGCNQRYVDTCTGLVELYKQYTPLVEVYSVDEVFLDVTGTCHVYGSPADMAANIKSKIKGTYGITASVGIAPNKLVAKIASDMQKPDGLVVIKGCQEARGMLKDLPVGEVTGIGPRIESRLEDMGIRTCGELGEAPVPDLKEEFGVIGERLHFMALGIDRSPVITADQQAPAKSVGHSMTLDRNVGDLGRLKSYILKLSEMVGRRLRRAGCKGRTASLTIRYSDFTTISKRKTVKKHISDGIDICNLSVSILRSFRLEDEVRMIGVSMSNLVECNQLPLFSEDRKRRDISHALDRINDRLGEFSVFRGALLESNSKPDTISPAWRPDGIKRIDY